VEVPATRLVRLVRAGRETPRTWPDLLRGFLVRRKPPVHDQRPAGKVAFLDVRPPQCHTVIRTAALERHSDRHVFVAQFENSDRELGFSEVDPALRDCVDELGSAHQSGHGSRRLQRISKK
jgi:hypothetical protein